MSNRLSFLASLAILTLCLTVAPFQRADAQTSQVHIVDFAFDPSYVSVPSGTTITWTNTSQRNHTTTSDGGLWDSGDLGPGQTFTHTFNQPGTFTYHCAIHSFMTGTVVVTGNPSPTASPPTSVPTGVPTVLPTASPTIPPQPTNTEPPATITPAQTPTPTPTSIPPVTVIRQTIVVKRSHGRYVFTPKSQTVRLGTRVTWKNASDAPHTITSTSRNWRMNKRFGKHGNVVLVFQKRGTFTYKCTIHPYMKGTIRVR